MHRSFFAAVTSAAVIASLAAAPSAFAWTWPAEGPVLRPFSVGSDPYAAGQHRGVDVGAELGHVVVAPAGGTVSFVGFVPGGGRAVTIATDDGYAVTLLQLGATSVERGSTLTEGTVVGVVGESSDSVTLQPHVHLGVRVAADPNGYVNPLGLLPLREPTVPPPTVPPSVPVEAPPVAAPVSAAQPTEVVDAEAAAESVRQPEPPRASRSDTAAASRVGNPSGRPVAVKRTARPISRESDASRAALSKSVVAPTSALATATRAGAAAESPSPTRVAPRALHRTSVPKGPIRPALPVGRLPLAAGKSRPGSRAVFDRFADAAAPPGEQSGGRDSRDVLPVLMTIAATVLLALGTWLGRGRYRRTREAENDARMMNRHEYTASTPEDPRRGRVAVCERPATHRPRGGIWRPGGHLRPLPPVARERRPHGERDGRARHAGDGRRRSSRGFAA